jgi:hypothetical protein
VTKYIRASRGHAAAAGIVAVAAITLALVAASVFLPVLGNPLVLVLAPAIEVASVVQVPTVPR